MRPPHFYDNSYIIINSVLFLPVCQVRPDGGSRAIRGVLLADVRGRSVRHRSRPQDENTARIRPEHLHLSPARDTRDDNQRVHRLGEACTASG